MKPLLTLCLLAILFGLAVQTAHSATRSGADIVWDGYDVPHIYANDDAAGFRAFGWAQMQMRAPTILKLYGLARGRGAEYWGESQYEQDVLTHRIGIPEQGRKWLQQLASADLSRIEAFAAGMNAFARTHPQSIPAEMRQVLPITADDVLAHVQRVVFLTYLAPWELDYAQEAEAKAAVRGSNGYAIAPSRSADGRAMLVINPHLSWHDEFLFIEAQLNLPSGSLYGIAAVGMPLLSIAFSEAGGWTHTVNQFDGSDTYALTLVDGGYAFDGKVLPFTTSEDTIKVRLPDGKVELRRLVTRHSVHGPVIMEGEQGRAYALRLAAFDSPGMLRQYWDMGAAPTLDAFEQASARLQMPFFNTIYANREGHIYYLYGGRSPQKNTGDWDFWQKVVPGDRSQFLWDERSPLAYSAMPHFRDPPSGFIQNANEPPWSTTIPNVLKPGDFAAYLAPSPSMDMRSQRSARRVLENPSIDFDQLVALKQDSGIELADRVLDDLLKAASTSTDSLVKQAAAVLQTWDRAANAGSCGAVLFVEWAKLASKLPERALFAETWNPAKPVATPRGLANPTQAVELLKEAAAQVESRWSRLDIAWGDVYRIRRDGVDLPASGGPHEFGAYRVMWAKNSKTGPLAVAGGDTFVAVVEFGERVKAVGLLAYGNSDTAEAPANKEQLELFSKGQLRPIWFYRDEVERNAARTDHIR